jgi:hypothetical protein
VFQITAAALVPLLVPLGPSTQEAGAEPEPYGFDASAIEWVLPGDFEAALARAKAEERLILIKGVAFGIDAEGASCATKGRW